MKNYTGRKYHIETYNPDWQSQFNDYKEDLQQIFVGCPIYHIGSTAIPGLVAKPVIDILILVDDLEFIDTTVEAMERLGYKYYGTYVKPDSRFFAMEKDEERIVNVHCFRPEHKHVAQMLGLKDYFLSHQQKVEEYSKLKLHLAEKFPNNYAEYRKQKDAWMDDLKQKIGLMD